MGAAKILLMQDDIEARLVN